MNQREGPLLEIEEKRIRIRISSNRENDYIDTNCMKQIEKILKEKKLTLRMEKKRVSSESQDPPAKQSKMNYEIGNIILYTLEKKVFIGKILGRKDDTKFNIQCYVLEKESYVSSSKQFIISESDIHSTVELTSAGKVKGGLSWITKKGWTLGYG